MTNLIKKMIERLTNPAPSIQLYAVNNKLVVHNTADSPALYVSISSIPIERSQLVVLEVGEKSSRLYVHSPIVDMVVDFVPVPLVEFNQKVEMQSHLQGAGPIHTQNLVKELAVGIPRTDQDGRRVYPISLTYQSITGSKYTRRYKILVDLWSADKKLEVIHSI